MALQVATSCSRPNKSCCSWGISEISEGDGSPPIPRRPPPPEDLPILRAKLLAPELSRELADACLPDCLGFARRHDAQLVTPMGSLCGTPHGEIVASTFLGPAMRDRTLQFKQIRTLRWAHARLLYEGAAGTPPTKKFLQRSDQVGMPAEGFVTPRRAHTRDAASSLAKIYDEASQLITSLDTKLAQHNGLRQFGVEFADRVPPFEQRMLVPTLEASIEDSIARIALLATKVQTLEVSGSGSSSDRLRGNMREYMAKAEREAKAVFKSQRDHLRVLACASPLMSPMLAPDLSRKLSVAMATKSPTASACSSPPGSGKPSPYPTSDAAPFSGRTTAPSSSEASSRKPEFSKLKLPDTLTEGNDNCDYYDLEIDDLDDFELPEPLTEGETEGEGKSEEFPAAGARKPFRALFP